MRRNLLLFLLSLIFLSMAWMTGMVAMATLGLLHVGQPGFPLQQAAEQSVATLTPLSRGKAEYLLTLLERRTGDLERSAGGSQEADALAAVTEALKQSIYAIAQTPAADWPALRTRLLKDIQSIQSVLTTVQAPGAAALSAWLPALETSASDLNQNPSQMLALLTPRDPDAQAGAALAAAREIAAQAAAPHVVRFQAGSPGALHDFFPLDGKHAAIACESCHQDGRYAGTPRECRACHGKDEPKDHYPAECGLCHTAAAWKPATFDHAAVDTSNCENCHKSDRPQRHYPGQCSTCHGTDAWKPAHFDHAGTGASDCQSCHSRPSGHWNGQCSACHSTGAWKPAHFNHGAANATDCQSCHNRPSGHWSGQCSACHSTNGWRPAHFNHAAANATDCQACHNRPSGHWSGQCSACHSTDGWRPAHFDHGAARATDCQACHNRPSGHWSGQCSACHSTSGWRPANFDHGAANATDCQSCHRRPNNHFEGQCSNCHSTSGWGGASFKHEFDMNHGGANGQCALCHPSGPPETDCSACHGNKEGGGGGGGGGGDDDD